ncbi:tyrosine-type recombinase/integrase [Candidatus Bathyarchaeota archaeon]|nr:tyrosine-type recombinase/integrase [Candidatus Bathyarchaeota archaeon]
MESLKMKRGSTGRKGYWASHQYSRRAVVDLNGKEFCGWGALAKMCEAAMDTSRYTWEQQFLCERDRALIAILFLTGARADEVVRLRKSMFTFDEAWIYGKMIPVVKSWRYVDSKKTRVEKQARGEKPRTKTLKKTREIVFPRREPLSEILIEWLDQVQDYLFPSKFHRHRKHLSPIRAYQIVCDLAERTGFDMWPHRLRSERASQLGSEYGYRTRDIMRFFAWESEKTARRYVHESIEDMKKRIPEISYNLSVKDWLLTT